MTPEQFEESLSAEQSKAFNEILLDQRAELQAMLASVTETTSTSSINEVEALKADIARLIADAGLAADELAHTKRVSEQVQQELKMTYRDNMEKLNNEITKITADHVVTEIELAKLRELFKQS